MTRGLDSLYGLHFEKRKSRIAIISCRARGAVFPHTLLYGVGGTGKTALARAIGWELGYHFDEIEAANLRSRKAVIDRLVSSTEKASALNKILLLFIDECHRLGMEEQEALYYPMREWRVTTREGIVRLPHFTLFGATTRRDMLDGHSFYERFINKWRIDRYEILDMCQVVESMFKKEGIQVTADVISAVAARSLGIPRRAENLVSYVRDQALYRGSRVAMMEDVLTGCELHGIDQMGLDETHLHYLRVLNEDPEIPKGLSTMSMSLEETEDALKGMIEPILLSKNFVRCTPRGRMITSLGRRYLGC